jgi:predicted  nucleic acid-binding Zn-ribbon protein
MTEKKDLELLLAVQVVDRELLALRKEKARMPESIRAEEEGLSAFERMVGEERKRLEDLVRVKKQGELEIDANVEAIRRFRAQQFQVKKNEEYNSLGREIADKDHENDLLQEKVLGQIEEIEQIESSLRRRDEEGKAKRGELEALRARVAREIETLDERVREAAQRRAELVGAAPTSLIGLYDRIRGGKPDGVAVALVERDACSGCQAKLPPQRKNELLRSEKVVLCEACGRILVWDARSEDLRDIV